MGRGVGAGTGGWYLAGEIEDVVFCKDWGWGEEVVENVHLDDLVCTDDLSSRNEIGVYKELSLTEISLGKETERVVQRIKPP